MLSDQEKNEVLHDTVHFVYSWYPSEEIFRCLKQDLEAAHGRMPRDISSIEFAEWLADQYRLAMLKGIDLAKQAFAQEFKRASNANLQY